MKLLQLPNPGNGGRLGNQLFTIAACIGIAHKYGYQPRIPSDWKYRQYFPNIPDEYFGVIEPCYITLVEPSFEYTDVPPLGNIVNMRGYFQSYKYFDHVPDIRKMMMPIGAKPDSIDEKCQHFRRGDYVGNKNYAQLKIGYYSYDFESFSDDANFLKVHFSKTPEDEIIDFIKMISYKRHVISNSTFAWWAAYLSGGAVNYPNEWLAGPLSKYSTKDMFPPHWVVRENKKADLKDFTFIIPVMYDHQDRADNLAKITGFLNEHFDTNIIVGEINTTKMNADVRFDFNGHFHRTKALNEMTKQATTPYVVNYDADVLFSPFQIMKMANELRNGADVCYPYDGAWINIPRNHFASITNDLAYIGSQNFRPSLGESVGGAVGYNKEAFLKAGGENENFVSYGPEDAERYWRFNLLGLDIKRVPGPLYHLEHYRGPDSQMRGNKDSQAGHKYWEWLKANHTTKEQLVEHLGLHEVRGYAGGWELEDAIKEHAFSLELAYYIGKTIKPHASIIDIGCGPGFYSAFLSRQGFIVRPTDATPQDVISFVDIDCLDISLKIEHWGKYNVLLCLEVGEHIEAKHESIVLDNLSALATDKIIMSWAVPGQRGFGHVNCRENDYIIVQMVSRGWAYNEEQSNFLRQHCSGCTWFENTLMIFDK